MILAQVQAECNQFPATFKGGHAFGSKDGHGHGTASGEALWLCPDKPSDSQSLCAPQTPAID